MYRLISYNLHSGVGRDGVQDYHRIGDMLAEKNADFVLLQEMDTRASERNTQSDIDALCQPGGYTFVPAATQVTSHGWFGNALLSRHTVIRDDVVTLNVTDREPRNLQRVWVETPHHSLLLHNTHLGLSRKERRQQVKLIQSALEDGTANADLPAMLAGDLNEWWYLSNLFARLKPVMHQLDTGLSFPSHFPVFKLDRLWVTHHCQILNCGLIKDRVSSHFSDHLPVFADFAIKDKR